jgi:5S rRNA maturation endonuclease (ribonuclease M5)
MTGVSFDRVVDAFHNQGLNVRTLGAGKATAQAPGHSKADMSVSITDIGGRVLVWSHSDPTEDVLASLNLSMSDLFDDPKGVTYQYADGRNVSRSPFKKFSQSGNTRGTALYRSDRLAESPVVYVVEGEQDVHALESAGAVATCTAMGAGKAHLFDLSPLRGKTVRIIRDMDEAGLGHAKQVAALLDGIAKVEMLEPAIGKDAADHIAAGFTVDQFVAVTPRDEEFEQEVERGLRNSRIRLEVKRRESMTGAAELNPKLLGDILAMSFEHDWLIEGLLERRDRLILTGGEGAGKSFLSRQLAISAAAGVHPFTSERIEPRRVLVVDAENSELQWSRNTRYVTALTKQMGQGDPHTNVLVSAGVRLDFARKADVDLVHKQIDSHKPDIVYLGPLYKLLSGAITNDDDAAPLIVALDSFRERGVTLLMEAHAGHSKGFGGERELRPRGSAALMGWPEFGLGLRPIEDDDHMVSLVRWRGDRDERAWPHRLRRGVEGEMPWMKA